MSLKSVVQQLRALPYTEMRALAKTVGELLDIEQTHNISETNIADVLSQLPVVTNDELDKEQRVLATFFNRKRAITVTTASRENGPWTISCEGGIQVTSATLRGALSEFLDAQAAYLALRK